MKPEYFPGQFDDFEQHLGAGAVLHAGVDGQENPDAAVYYPDPKPGARSVSTMWRSGAGGCYA